MSTHEYAFSEKSDSKNVITREIEYTNIKTK